MIGFGRRCRSLFHLFLSSSPFVPFVNPPPCPGTSRSRAPPELSPSVVVHLVGESRGEPAMWVDLPDETLMQRVAANDAAAFDALFRRHRCAVFSYTFRMLSDGQ